jgi:hypothetical protein
MWVMIGSVAGFCDHGYELSSSVKGRGIFDQLRDYQLFCKNSDPFVSSVIIAYCCNVQTSKL